MLNTSALTLSRIRNTKGPNIKRLPCGTPHGRLVCMALTMGHLSLYSTINHIPISSQIGRRRNSICLQCSSVCKSISHRFSHLVRFEDSCFSVIALPLISCVFLLDWKENEEWKETGIHY